MGALNLLKIFSVLLDKIKKCSFQYGKVVSRVFWNLTITVCNVIANSKILIGSCCAPRLTSYVGDKKGRTALILHIKGIECF